MPQTDKIRIALADDHAMFRRGLVSILKAYKEIDVLFDAANGHELLGLIADAEEKPHVCILDIKMPVMNGYETARKLHRMYPGMFILALSMFDDESNIIQMLRSGAHGYLLKESEPAVLVDAIKTVYEKGFYDSELITETLRDKLKNSTENITISAQEASFLKYACTDMTYKEIATAMAVSERTVDGYRDRLFDKLNVKSRIGLVIYAIDNEIVDKY